MSDFILYKGHREPGSIVRHYGSPVTDVLFEPDEPTAIELSDGRTGTGSCLGCGSSPCMTIDQAELTLPGALADYPGDPSTDVCPTRAIQWDAGEQVAVVAEGDCVGCGLCVSRCPYGAISLVDGAVARVEADDPDGLITTGTVKGNHPTPKRSGQIAWLDAPAASVMPVTAGDPEKRPRLLVRNLLNAVGLTARVHRQGDTNVRIDAVGYSRSERPIVAEIEFSASVLESPRALLEDIAVMHARYGYATADIDPVSVTLVLPNIRSEYYRVLQDTETVLGLRVRTLTVGALIALLWTCSKLDGFDGRVFMAADGTIDLTGSLGIDPALLREPYPGAFKPSK